ncbi:MAG: DEAD/DEAH box helicase [Opitutaceae bacterium]|nr:DEAD/DEAH box helicase [Opitutaceae bacterium]
MLFCSCSLSSRCALPGAPTKTAQAVKRLRSRYAFVLTGTPIENRIDELYSIVDFLDPAVFGPLFRFNREFYAFDEKGRPAGYRNLDRLHARVRPVMLRRRKADVETELPARTDHIRLVPLSDVQRQNYAAHEQIVSKLVHLAKRRPLLPAEQDKLMRELAMLRMICDTNYILGDGDRTCPKLGELEPILAECRDNPGVKVIVFSEWERMLELVRSLCGRLGLGFAWHTGSVPQQRRRAEINRFKSDPACRVFLSTDSGGVGLNLQTASVVVNCDLPWNPAKLEQRIARAWRKHQARAVTVYNLVSVDTIEHGMLATLADKRSLADGVLDRLGDLKEIRLRSGRQAQLARLEQIMLSGVAGRPPAKPPPADPALAFAQRAAAEINGHLCTCEERYPAAPDGTAVIVVIVDREAGLWRPQLEAAHADTWQHAPSEAPRLLVLDRATQDALDALAASGLMAVTTAATRRLHPLPEAPVALSPEEQQRAATHRAQAARKLKAAQALLAAGLPEEAAAPVGDALHALGCALALERRLPAPPDSAACARTPWSGLFPAPIQAVLPEAVANGETGIAILIAALADVR